jgi:hypothetical protein
MNVLMKSKGQHQRYKYQFLDRIVSAFASAFVTKISNWKNMVRLLKEKLFYTPVSYLHVTILT